ncbi:PREDICTED: protein MNN4 [Wasmannia auropunctata]|uniref:protein MNN4 n=1 Tax=Wasmannia auropunctata TaxID=64793 RepID=UPI0005F02CDB|nr:PREDICTED: protein MNN4 [Wasmannia auropunctata]
MMLSATVIKRRSGICINVDSDFAEKLLERRLRKREETEEINERADVNFDEISQENIVQSKQKMKERKRTLNEASNDDSPKHTTNEMPQENIVQSKRKKEKRKGTLNEASYSNDVTQKTNEISQENIVQSKQKNKEGKRTLNKASNDDNHNTDEVSQENIVQRKRKKRNIERTLNEDNGDDTDISKEAAENVKSTKELSKRQLKKQKVLQEETKKRKSQKSNAKQKALSYLSTWKYSRNEWKFEKLKQIWLMNNLLNEDAIPDSLFPVVLEYFEGCKGKAREGLLSKGMEVIRKAEMELDEDKKEEIMKSIAYRRARQLLQTLH